MLIFLLAALQQTPAAPIHSAEDTHYHECLKLATSDPDEAETNANEWRLQGGGLPARECLGVAYANQRHWVGAATEFQSAAHDAEAAKDDRAARYWAEAGNAWLAAGDPAKARAALNAALASGALSGEQRGEAQIDRARALVAGGDLAAARTDLDHALVLAPDDTLAWLLSATLARRMKDLPRAHKDIAEALKRSPQEAPVQLEAGNIAAMSGNEAGARSAWEQAVKIAPDSPAGANAAQALRQFDTPPAP